LTFFRFSLFSDILKDADLDTMSAKKVRLQLEENLSCSLVDRKKEIDEMVMDFVNSKTNEEDDDVQEVLDSEEDNKKRKKAKEPGAEDDDDDSDDSDFSVERAKKSKKKKAKARKAKKRKAREEAEESESSESEWEKPAPEKKKKGTGKGGYMASLTLSPELARLMKAEALPRHEVVKKMWAIIKERNLYDPKNKQFAICDADLFSVIKVKRFRTFGMMKYLKEHFIVD
jgi:upstream activation factor subunit UAF30